MPRFDFDPSITPIEHFASCSSFERKALIRDFEQFDVYTPGSGVPNRDMVKDALQDDNVPVANLSSFFTDDRRRILLYRGIVVFRKDSPELRVFMQKLSSFPKNTYLVAIIVSR